MNYNNLNHGIQSENDNIPKDKVFICYDIESRIFQPTEDDTASSSIIVVAIFSIAYWCIIIFNNDLLKLLWVNTLHNNNYKVMYIILGIIFLIAFVRLYMIFILNEKSNLKAHQEFLNNNRASISKYYSIKYNGIVEGNDGITKVYYQDGSVGVFIQCLRGSINDNDNESYIRYISCLSQAFKILSDGNYEYITYTLPEDCSNSDVYSFYEDKLKNSPSKDKELDKLFNTLLMYQIGITKDTSFITKEVILIRACTSNCRLELNNTVNSVIRTLRATEFRQVNCMDSKLINEFFQKFYGINVIDVSDLATKSYSLSPLGRTSAICTYNQAKVIIDNYNHIYINNTIPYKTLKNLSKPHELNSNPDIRYSYINLPLEISQLLEIRKTTSVENSKSIKPSNAFIKRQNNNLLKGANAKSDNKSSDLDTAVNKKSLEFNTKNLLRHDKPSNESKQLQQNSNGTNVINQTQIITNMLFNDETNEPEDSTSEHSASNTEDILLLPEEVNYRLKLSDQDSTIEVMTTSSINMK